jgi:DHA2 family multidrug resistance protein
VITAVGLYNLTRLSLDTSFATITQWRMFQVIGLPLVFIPISTLNYVGVPTTKMNQISSLSNFARNLGGSAGTALLTTFLARTAQTHQMQLAAHSGAGSAGYNNYISHITSVARSQGMSGGQAGHVAVGYAYQQMLRQASMLSYKNAFALLAGVIICLTPLPFVMRLPAKAAKPSPEAAGH